MNRVIQTLVAMAFILLLIGAVGYFAPTVRDDPVWPWFTVSGMLSSVALLLAIFTKE